MDPNSFDFDDFWSRLCSVIKAPEPKFGTGLRAPPQPPEPKSGTGLGGAIPPGDAPNLVSVCVASGVSPPLMEPAQLGLPGPKIWFWSKSGAFLGLPLLESPQIGKIDQVCQAAFLIDMSRRRDWSWRLPESL